MTSASRSAHPSPPDVVGDVAVDGVVVDGVVVDGVVVDGVAVDVVLMLLLR
jgi:hypothetical protein